VRRVLPHPVALDQCRDFVSLSSADRGRAVLYTAGSVKRREIGGGQIKRLAASLDAARSNIPEILQAALQTIKTFTAFF